MLFCGFSGMIRYGHRGRKNCTNVSPVAVSLWAVNVVINPRLSPIM